MKKPFKRGNTAKNRERTRFGTNIETKYELSTTKLGQGAYACVMLGKERTTGQSVAIKRIEKEGLKHRDMQKVHKEVKILSALSHKNVVKVYDSYEDDKYFYMVMEYVPNGELLTRITDENYKFTEADCRNSIMIVLQSLKYCKDVGVIHRDLKPDNILVGEGNELKVADFNLSKQVDKDVVDYNILQTMCGTPSYVAPEVVSGTPYNYKCDVWSLGVIAFLLLSGGYLPFFVNRQKEGANARNALLNKVKNGNWAFRPSRAWVNVSHSAKDFISRMLDRDPESRATYEELLGHPWMKAQQQALNQRIETKRFLGYNQMRKIHAAKVMRDVVDRFKDLMGSDKNLVSEDEGDVIPVQSGEMFFGNSLDYFD